MSAANDIFKTNYYLLEMLGHPIRLAMWYYFMHQHYEKREMCEKFWEHYIDPTRLITNMSDMSDELGISVKLLKNHLPFFGYSNFIKIRYFHDDQLEYSINFPHIKQSMNHYLSLDWDKRKSFRQYLSTGNKIFLTKHGASPPRPIRRKYGEWNHNCPRMEYPQRKSSRTYIMFDENIGLYKIGKSNDPSIRERTLQGSKPTIKLFAVSPRNCEKELHREYRDYRVRGEWFRLNADMVNKIISDYNFEKTDNNQII